MIEQRILFFIAAAELGSFSSAGKKYYVSQAAISQQITMLEEKLGVQLFNRTGYRPVLTEAGQYFYEECGKLVESCRLIEKNTQEIGEKIKKKILVIGITGPLESIHLPSIAACFKKHCPEVLLEVKKITFEDGVKDLEAGTLDATFGILNDFKGKANICATVLFRHRVCVVCSKNHPWADRTWVDSQEIAWQPIVAFSEKVGSSFYVDFIESFKKDGIKPNIVRKYDNLEELLMAVKINQGIALIAREVIVNDEALSMLDIVNTHHHAEFCVGYLYKNEKEYLKTFIEDTVSFYTQLKL